MILSLSIIIIIIICLPAIEREIISFPRSALEDLLCLPLCISSAQHSFHYHHHILLHSFAFFLPPLGIRAMDMAEIPKQETASCSSSSCCGCGEAVESEQKNKGTQKICVSDHIHAFQYTAEKADSFVIDMDAFSSASNKDNLNTTNNNANANSRITRSHSRKGSQRGGERKLNGNAPLHDKDTVSATCSPKGNCTPEKGGGMVGVGSTIDHSTSPHIHHQISISAGSGTNAESKSMTRRNSFRRSSSWALDPKRVLLFFATLSSMGTMLLIYFTLTISKQNADEYGD